MNGESPIYDAAVIGGGFFGCSLALVLARSLDRVVLLEKESDLLQRASYANQARVHNGYHYPKSLLTALRSRVNFPRFLEDYADCIDDTFEQHYAIARRFSDVNARQFQLFCQRIGAPAAPASKDVQRLFNPDLIEAVFRVEECAFDAVRLQHRLRRDLEARGVLVRTNSTVRKVAPVAGDPPLLSVLASERDGGTRATLARYVFNCTYSQLNQILSQSSLPVVHLKHEVTEIALVEMPTDLRHLGITVMCGPFFSVMPFPSRGLHSLSHVRYTPHHVWQDTRDSCLEAHAYLQRVPRRSSYLRMIKDAQRYVPALARCRYVESLWEVKTVLPQSEVDDSRPILFIKDHGLPNFACIMGGKIDNIYDVISELDGWGRRVGIA